MEDGKRIAVSRIACASGALLAELGRPLSLRGAL